MFHDTLVSFAERQIIIMEKKIRKLVSDILQCSIEEIDNTALLEEYGFSSIDLLDLASELEDNFNIQISSEDLTYLSSIENIKLFLTKKGVR